MPSSEISLHKCYLKASEVITGTLTGVVIISLQQFFDPKAFVQVAKYDESEVLRSIEYIDPLLRDRERDAEEHSRPLPTKFWTLTARMMIVIEAGQPRVTNASKCKQARARFWTKPRG